MKSSEVKKRSGVDKTFNIKFDVKLLHPEYELLYENENHIKDTGLMMVFELLPVKRVGPRFVGRWDENSECLDIDIYDVDATTRDNFRRKKDGYFGHQPKLIRPDHRTFHIYIKILDKLYINTNIFFNVNRTLKAESGKFNLK